MTEKSDPKLLNALDIGVQAMDICQVIHEQTGATKIPLIDVANEMSKGIKKKDIQDAFWLLVSLGILGDDGDEDHMNYNDGHNELTALLKQIKIEELSKEAETPKVYL